MAIKMNPAQVKVIIDKNKEKREAFKVAREKSVKVTNEALDEAENS